MVLAVSVVGLSKKYGNFLALDKIDLAVEEGKLFALMGPNGAGKTTLLRILTTQFPPTSGAASVFGNSVESDGALVRGLVSYVPQEMSVWTDISGYENLLIYSKIYGLPSGKREAAIRLALKTMELEGVEDRLVSTYSGGMIRKLELACAIMIRPKILFLDEPTIGLDPSARKTVWDKIKSLNAEYGVSVFFTTHYMDEAESYADIIGIINHGRIIKVASPEEMKRSVGDERIEIELKNPRIGLNCLELLRKIPGVAHAKSKGNTLNVWVRDSSVSLNPIMEFLIGRKMHVTKVSAFKPTIEDVFLRYAATAGGEDPVNNKGGDIGELKRVRARIRG